MLYRNVWIHLSGLRPCEVGIVQIFHEVESAAVIMIITQWEKGPAQPS